ncbi:MAG: hypothetical protein H6605_04125 [Flavobacteriales bacterium]|nr:hypothetical protein [Flavobacteriales bacterium]
MFSFAQLLKVIHSMVYLFTLLCLFFLFSSFSIVQTFDQPKYVSEHAMYVDETNYKMLKKYNSIIFAPATKYTDTILNKNGLFEIDSVKNTHFDYYCSITKPIGNTVAKGYYKNNVPTGVWVKFNHSTDSSFNEYFFMKSGICMKHVFFWHHDGSYFMDSITPTMDTLIRMSFNTKLGQKDYYYIPQKGDQGYFDLKEINFRKITVYPRSIYKYQIKK